MKKSKQTIKKNRQYDYTVFGFEIVEDEGTLAKFSLESGGMILRPCYCEYDHKGNLQFCFPGVSHFSPEQEDPRPGIIEQLENQVVKLKEDRHDQWNVPINGGIPF